MNLVTCHHPGLHPLAIHPPLCLLVMRYPLCLACRQYNSWHPLLGRVLSRVHIQAKSTTPSPSAESCTTIIVSGDETWIPALANLVTYMIVPFDITGFDACFDSSHPSLDGVLALFTLLKAPSRDRRSRGECYDVQRWLVAAWLVLGWRCPGSYGRPYLFVVPCSLYSGRLMPSSLGERVRVPLYSNTTMVG